MKDSSFFVEDFLSPEQRSSHDGRAYRFDGFYFDPAQRRLTFGENAVAISPKALDTLLVFVENRGGLIGKEDFHRRLWPDTFVEDVTLARAISDLRRILGRYSKARFIETVSKHGYRFMAQVNCIASNPASADAPAISSETADYVGKAWHAARQWSQDSVRRGIEYARRAIAVDPSDAEAYAVLAYLYLYTGFGLLPGQDAFPRARAAAESALKFDPQCSAAHAVLAMVAVAHDRDLKAAERFCQTAVRCGPRLMAGHFAYSHLLLIRGCFDQALDEARLAMELDPLSCAVAYHCGNILYYAGRTQEAIAQFLKFEFLDPDFLPAHQTLALLYARFNRAEEAYSEAAKAISLSAGGSRGTATLAMANALLGKHDEARSILRQIQKNPAVPGFQWSYAQAAIYSCLNEPDAAIACIEQACREGDGAVIYLRHDPHFIELRDDSRFEAILDRIGL